MKEYIELKRRIVYRGDAYQAINDELIKVSAYAISSEYMRGVEDGMKRTLGVLAHRVKDIPAADVVEVRHGRWLTKEYMYGDPDVGIEDMWVDRLAEQSDYYAYCSVCGKDAEYNGEGSLVLSDCCPSCGAKMDGGHDD